MIKGNSYNNFKKYMVNDVSSVKEFLNKYYKKNRINCKETLLSNYEEDFNKYGFCFISHHDNITGEVVSFYG